MPARNSVDLSPEADRLYGYLMERAPSRDLARRDAVIAAALDLDVRHIIDLADELLAVGFLVLAETAPPAGRWLLMPGDDLAPAHRYARSLRSRALAIMLRARRVRTAIAAAQTPPLPSDYLLSPPGDSAIETDRRMFPVRACRSRFAPDTSISHHMIP